MSAFEYLQSGFTTYYAITKKRFTINEQFVDYGIREWRFFLSGAVATMTFIS
jgi:hypothetical protein